MLTIRHARESLGFSHEEAQSFWESGNNRYKDPRASWGGYFGTCQLLPPTLGLYQNVFSADVFLELLTEAWFRWAGDSAALLGVRVEAPRDMGFLRKRR